MSVRGSATLRYDISRFLQKYPFRDYRRLTIFGYRSPVATSDTAHAPPHTIFSCLTGRGGHRACAPVRSDRRANQPAGAQRDDRGGAVG
ncbi:hypothetical protein SPHINGO391_360075 [Sphingomonas aurantiaca]|uniref:Uncharacterized protein n=1 Tax=Sphingomonas aurantiaca TaxID=185949 RepID=A0A5E7YL76_9SPHN|nr:hypothetical protein SPHINGO391_360075 [Sphingomonas aurantiaca]